MPLRSIDRHILAILQEEGRISNVRLSERVGISPSATLERVRRLERAGVIRGYRAHLDPERVDRAILAFLSVGLEVQNQETMERFGRMVAEAPEVLECHHMAGDADFLLKVAVKDIKAYREFIQTTLGRIEGIRSVRSSFVLGTFKETTAFDLKEPEEVGSRADKKEST